MNNTGKQGEAPLVSVIIPAYNRPKLLKRAVVSVISQTYKNLQIIIVDDGSVEDIKPVVDGFGDSRIEYIRHENNKGVSAARNTGIRASLGEYISFLDDDDEYLPEKTARQVEVLNRGEADLVCCGMCMGQGNEWKYRLKHRKHPWFYLLQQILVNKESVKKAGFLDTGFLHGCEDKDYLYRLSKICRIAEIPEPLLFYHDTPGSLSEPNKKKIMVLNADTQRFLAKHPDLAAQGKSSLYYRLGKRYKETGRLSEGCRCLFRCILARPFCERAVRALRLIVQISPSVLFYKLKRRKGNYK